MPRIMNKITFVEALLATPLAIAAAVVGAWLFAGCGSDEASVKSGAVVELDASSKDAWSYFSLRTGSLLSVSDPSNSVDWDLAFQRTNIRTNSGTSGPGAGGALSGGSTDFDGMVEAPTDGYEADKMVPKAGPPGSGEVSSCPAFGGSEPWYNYDTKTNTASAKGTVYYVRAADGKYGKFQITSYANGVGATGYYSFRWSYRPDGSRKF